MNFLGMGPLELMLILGLALVVFGPEKLPDIARQVARTIVQIRRVTSEVTGDLQRSLQIDELQRPPYGSSTNGTSTPRTPAPSTFTPPATVPPPPPTGETPRRRSATDDDALLPPY